MAAVTQQTASQFVLEERSGEVVTLRLNRSEKLNALNVEMAQALVHALLRASDDKGVRAVILTGAGRAFLLGWRLALPARCAEAKSPPGSANTFNRRQGDLSGDRDDAQDRDRGR